MMDLKTGMWVTQPLTTFGAALGTAERGRGRCPWSQAGGGLWCRPAAEGGSEGRLGGEVGVGQRVMPCRGGGVEWQRALGVTDCVSLVSTPRGATCLARAVGNRAQP